MPFFFCLDFISRKKNAPSGANLLYSFVIAQAMPGMWASGSIAGKPQVFHKP
jgi:hypothetical protein